MYLKPFLTANTMDIVVHGTKGGRQIFTPKKLGGLLDINSDTSNASAIGGEAYAIRFLEKSIIFSKYKIIRDVRGDKRTGFLGFSLFMPNNYKLTGADIINLLNKVSEEYCRRYIPDRDNNLKDVRENWDFLDRILEEFKVKLRPVLDDDIENLLSDTKDDAFIYYENDEKLKKYYDAPYQDEYSPYRQVLFIQEGLKDKPENPLNALRHSDDNLTGKIDLENPKYKLLYNQTAKGGVRIDVKVNGITRSKKSKVRRKDELEMSWSKLYCETITKRGRWNEISNEFIDVNDSSETVSIKEIMLPDKTKTIIFDIKDWIGNPVFDAHIICKNNNELKTVINNKVIFQGDDLGKRWTVSASRNNFLSEKKQINFEKDCQGASCVIKIDMNKHELNIIAHEGNLYGDIIPNDNINKNKTEFIGSEIEESHKIVVSCRGFDSYSFFYCPAKDENPKHISLQKRQHPYGNTITDLYYVNPGKHGTLKGEYGSVYSSKKRDGSDVKHLIVPHKGYRFTRFKTQDDTHIAQYEKKKYFYQNPKFIAGSIVGAVLLAFGISAWYYSFNKVQPEQMPDISHVQAYIEGNTLILNTLISYKNIQGIEQTEVSKSLDSAIKKRELINTMNFTELKKISYYPSQKKFKTAIENIDSAKYNDVKNRLVNISSWSLNQIADSINAASILAKPATENKPQVKPEQKNEQSPKEKIQPAKPDQNREQTQLSPPGKIDNTSQIIQYLKGDELKKDVLKEYINDARINVTLKKSLQLCLKFWELDGSKNNSYSSFQQQINNDANFKNSMLKSFVDDMYKKDKPQYPKEVEGVPAGITNTLQKLKSKIKK
jgi:hypothetical protein